VNKQDNRAPKKPSARNNHICLPLESEQHYTECINDTVQYRKFLAQQFAKWRELFPAAFANGYQFHSKYRQKKQDLVVRRIQLNTIKKVFAIRPSLSRLTRFRSSQLRGCRGYRAKR
jgi:hypothetical protein